jgi:hypothetical protein
MGIFKAFYPQISQSPQKGKRYIFILPLAYESVHTSMGAEDYEPFVLSLSKHERCSDAFFDKLRVNGNFFWGLRVLCGDRFVR